MKLKVVFLLLFVCVFQKNVAQTTVEVFNQGVVFYGGGITDLTTLPPDSPEVLRLRSHWVSRKLTQTELNSFGSTVTLNVKVQALCDNYDRIGRVNLAFVPKGKTTYAIGDTDINRMEIARFITPFMNKNYSPSEVPYSYSVDNLARIFKDGVLNTQYDFWVEMQIIGYPGSAQTQVTGCTDRKDVFKGFVQFISNLNSVTADEYLEVLSYNKNLNNYLEGASDAIGTTERTINFNLANPVYNASFYLIMSNHGANVGGEEYNRRTHYMYFDNNLKLTYIPGETSCEPYRIYNTMPNGIYGSYPKSDEQWQSFSNWCPGAKIPIRKIDVGNLSAGEHTFKISVPDAVFVNAAGDFPVSLYLQGNNSNLGVNTYSGVEYSLFPNPSEGKFTIQSSENIKNVTVNNLLGQQIFQGGSNFIDISSCPKGIYVLDIEFENTVRVTDKIIKN